MEQFEEKEKENSRPAGILFSHRAMTIIFESFTQSVNVFTNHSSVDSVSQLSFLWPTKTLPFIWGQNKLIRCHERLLIMAEVFQNSHVEQHGALFSLFYSHNFSQNSEPYLFADSGLLWKEIALLHSLFHLQFWPFYDIICCQ